jgi:S1-C subfamily serine protease
MSNIASELSNKLADAIEAASSGVARVTGRRRIGSTGIIWSAGVIVTANHALHVDEGIEVGLADGTTIPATLAGRDPATDVAVLRIEPPQKATPIAWSDSPLRVGNLVLAAGRPGRTVRATLGLLSAIGEEWRTHGGGRIDRYLEVDGALPAGFSGGPLLDTDGRAIGMNTSRLLRGSGATVPHATLQRVVIEILEHGQVRRPQLGVGVYPVEGGLLIMSVRPCSAAHAAGLLVGDVLTAIDGRPLNDPAALQEALSEERIGKESTVRVIRAGETKDVAIRLSS